MSLGTGEFGDFDSRLARDSAEKIRAASGQSPSSPQTRIAENFRVLAQTLATLRGENIPNFYYGKFLHPTDQDYIRAFYKAPTLRLRGPVKLSDGSIALIEYVYDESTIERFTEHGNRSPEAPTPSKYPFGWFRRKKAIPQISLSDITRIEEHVETPRRVTMITIPPKNISGELEMDFSVWNERNNHNGIFFLTGREPFWNSAWKLEYLKGKPDTFLHRAPRIPLLEPNKHDEDILEQQLRISFSDGKVDGFILTRDGETATRIQRDYHIRNGLLLLPGQQLNEGVNYQALVKDILDRMNQTFNSAITQPS